MEDFREKLFAEEDDYNFGNFWLIDADRVDYVYLSNKELDVEFDTPLEVLEGLEEISAKRRVSAKNKLKAANQLINENLSELKKEWKIHVMPKTPMNGAKEADLFAFFKSLLLGDEVTKRVYMAKILYNYELAQRGNAEQIANAESNLPVFVFYIYGEAEACQAVLKEMQQTAPQPAPSGVKPRFSSAFKRSKLFYFTQSSGDIKLEYQNLLQAARAPQTQSVFSQDLTRFEINIGMMMCASCSSSRVRYACEFCPSQLYCNAACQKKDWPQHAPFCSN
jgi:hypothetical protein